jgi:hypothetical protein
MANHTSHGIVGSLDSQVALGAIERMLPGHQQQRRLLESPLCRKGFVAHTQAARLSVSSASPSRSSIHQQRTTKTQKTTPPLNKWQQKNMATGNVAHRMAAAVPPEAQHALNFRFNGVPAHLEGRYFVTHLGVIIEGHFKELLRDVRDNTNVQILLMSQHPCATWFRLCAEATSTPRPQPTSAPAYTTTLYKRSYAACSGYTPPKSTEQSGYTHPAPWPTEFLTFPTQNQYPAAPPIQ